IGAASCRSGGRRSFWARGTGERRGAGGEVGAGLADRRWRHRAAGGQLPALVGYDGGLPGGGRYGALRDDGQRLGGVVVLVAGRGARGRRRRPVARPPAGWGLAPPRPDPRRGGAAPRPRGHVLAAVQGHGGALLRRSL